MDCFTILSKKNMDLLTEYWFKKGRLMGILFPNKFTRGYLTVGTLEQVMRHPERNVDGCQKGRYP